MTLDIVKLQTTWNDAAGSINSNYAKIADAIAQLKANGGGGGGGADIDLTDYATKVWVEAQGYITASALTPYALKADIPSLAGYATEVFVNNKLGDYATQDYVATKLLDYAPLTSVQGFENRIGGLEGAVPQLNDRVTTVEGKVSSLNETVSTGENNLLDRVNTIETEYVTSGNLESAINGIDLSAYLLKADLTKSRIQSTLGISDWALASVKPTYTASEVGALGVKDTAQQSYGLRHSTTPISDTGLHWWSGQFQVSTEPVSGKVYLGSSGDYTVISVPNIDGTSSLANACVLRLGYNRQFFHEIFTSPNSNNIYHRNVNIGNGNPWRQFAFTSDIPTKLSQLTDDVVAGKYLLLSGGIINTDNTTPLTIKNTQSNATEVGIRFIYNNDSKGWIGYNTQSGTMLYTYNGAHRLGIKDDGTAHVDSNTLIHSGNIKDQYVAGVYDSYNPLMKITFKYADGGVTSNPAWLACWNDYTLTYVSPDNVKAGSATKLATRSKLWGNDFDGTADVSGDLYSDIWRIIKAPNWNGTFIQSANYDGTSELGNIYMTGMRGSKLISFNVWANNSEFSDNVTVAGNVGIGNTSPAERLDVSGNIKASGNINATSITINGVTITASNGTITVNGNVFAKGDITGGV